MTNGSQVLGVGFDDNDPIFGGERGLMPGTVTSIASAIHNFRTGMALTLLARVGMSNTAPEVDEGQWPTLTFVSTENEVKDHYRWLYKYLKENDTGEVVDADDVPSLTARRYVERQLDGNGWHLRIFKMQPGITTIDSVIALLNNEVAAGHIPALVVVDPADLISSGNAALAGHQTVCGLKTFAGTHQSSVVTTWAIPRSEGGMFHDAAAHKAWLHRIACVGEGSGLRPPFLTMTDRIIFQSMNRGGNTPVLHLMDYPQGTSNPTPVYAELHIHDVGGIRMTKSPF